MFGGHPTPRPRCSTSASPSQRILRLRSNPTIYSTPAPVLVQHLRDNLSAAALVRAIEEVNALIVGTPVYKGS
jgi:NAD(P)H-dependent FMN reductase